MTNYAIQALLFVCSHTSVGQFKGHHHHHSFVNSCSVNFSSPSWSSIRVHEGVDSSGEDCQKQV